MKVLTTTIKKTTIEALGEKRSERLNEILRKYVHDIERKVEKEKKVKVTLTLEDDVYSALQSLSEKYGIPISMLIELAVEEIQKDGCVDVEAKFYRELRHAIGEGRLLQFYPPFKQIDVVMAKSFIKLGATLRLQTKAFSPAELEELRKRGVIEYGFIDADTIVFVPGVNFDMDRL